MELVSMFLLGVLGTAHCLGMCGPLVLALATHGPRLSDQIAYHIGRVVTYGVLGTAAAALGSGLVGWAAQTESVDSVGMVTRVQVLVSLFSALLLLALGLMRLRLVKEPGWLVSFAPSSLPLLGRWHRWALAKGGSLGMFGLGLLFGLLPCGLSYAAFARVLAAGSPWAGAAMVIAFGAGTIPGLLVVGTGGAALVRRHRRWADVVAGLTMVGMALSVALDGFQSLF